MIWSHSVRAGRLRYTQSPPPQPQLIGTGRNLLRTRHRTVHQRDTAIGNHGLHEGIGHCHRNVEIAKVAAVLGVDELPRCRVITAQYAHLRPRRSLPIRPFRRERSNTRM